MTSPSDNFGQYEKKSIGQKITEMLRPITIKGYIATAVFSAFMGFQAGVQLEKYLSHKEVYIKKIYQFDLNNDGKKDLIIQLNNNSRVIFIQDKNGEYINPKKGNLEKRLIE